MPFDPKRLTPITRASEMVFEGGWPKPAPRRKHGNVADERDGGELRRQEEAEEKARHEADGL